MFAFCAFISGGEPKIKSSHAIIPEEILFSAKDGVPTFGPGKRGGDLRSPHGAPKNLFGQFRTAPGQ